MKKIKAHESKYIKNDVVIIFANNYLPIITLIS